MSKKPQRKSALEAPLRVVLMYWRCVCGWWSGEKTVMPKECPRCRAKELKGTNE